LNRGASDRGDAKKSPLKLGREARGSCVRRIVAAAMMLWLQ
jgi:hypothetical protein